MSVTVKTTRKAVEIAWETSGGGDGGEAPGGFPEFPVDPDYGIDEGAHPDNTLPGDLPHPDQGLPEGGQGGTDVDPGYGVEEGGTPAHPIYLPPYIDNSLPGSGPHPDNTLPGDLPDEIGLSDEQKEKLKEFLTGNLPPFEHVQPVSEGGAALAVQVFAQGQEGDWSNTAVMPNDGLAVLSYPKDFKGESYVEVRALDGSLVDSGTITVK